MSVPRQGGLRRAALSAVVLLALGGCAGGAGAVSQGDSAGYRYVSGQGATGVLPAADRKAAPHVTGQLLDGSAYDVSALRGQVVVLNFWGSWCAPCRAEADGLERVATASRSSGVQFVGVNVKDEVSTAAAYVRTHGLTYPSLFDRAGRIAVSFRNLPPAAIPSTLVIDRRGRVAARFLGGVTDVELTPVVTAIAAESAA